MNVPCGLLDCSLVVVVDVSGEHAATIFNVDDFLSCPEDGGSTLLWNVVNDETTQSYSTEDYNSQHCHILFFYKLHY